jgi:hypothetical protein
MNVLARTRHWLQIPQSFRLYCRYEYHVPCIQRELPRKGTIRSLCGQQSLQKPCCLKRSLEKQGLEWAYMICVCGAFWAQYAGTARLSRSPPAPTLSLSLSHSRFLSPPPTSNHSGCSVWRRWWLLWYTGILPGPMYLPVCTYTHTGLARQLACKILSHREWFLLTDWFCDYKSSCVMWSELRVKIRPAPVAV